MAISVFSVGRDTQLVVICLLYTSGYAGITCQYRARFALKSGDDRGGNSRIGGIRGDPDESAGRSGFLSGAGFDISHPDMESERARYAADGHRTLQSVGNSAVEQWL